MKNIALFIFLVAGISTAQNIRPITQINDVNKVGDEYYTKPVTWFAGDSIRFDVMARDGRTPINFAGAFPVLFVAAETNLAQVYIVATGTVVSATNGHVSVPVVAASALLDPVRAYAAWVTVFNVSAPTQEIATVAYSAVTVKASPLGTDYDYLTNGVAPWTIEVGNIDVVPHDWSAYPATQAVNMAGQPLTNGGALYADGRGITNLPAEIARVSALSATGAALAVDIAANAVAIAAETAARTGDVATLQSAINAGGTGTYTKIDSDARFSTTDTVGVLRGQYEGTSNQAAAAYGWGDHSLAPYATRGFYNLLDNPAKTIGVYNDMFQAVENVLGVTNGVLWAMAPTAAYEEQEIHQGILNLTQSGYSLFSRGIGSVRAGGFSPKLILAADQQDGMPNGEQVVIRASYYDSEPAAARGAGEIFVNSTGITMVVTLPQGQGTGLMYLTPTGLVVNVPLWMQAGGQSGFNSFHWNDAGDIWQTEPTNTAVLSIVSARSITSGAYYGRGDTLTGVATGTPIYSLAGYATGTPIYSVSGLATGSPLYEVDLSPYATGTPVYSLAGYATGTPIYTTAGLATGSPLYEVDLSPYATGTPVYSIAGLATGSPLYTVDLSPYATGTPVYTVAGLATGSPLYAVDLSPYATGTPIYTVSGLATGTPIYTVAGLATGTPLYEVDLAPYATGTPVYSLSGLATGTPLYEVDLSAYATGTPVYSVSGLATGSPLYAVDLSPYATGTPVYTVAGLATGSPLYEVDLTPYATGTPMYALGFDIADYTGTGTTAALQAEVTALGAGSLTIVDAASTYTPLTTYNAAITNVTAVNALRLGNSLPAAYVKVTDWQADSTNNVRTQTAYPTNTTAAGVVGSMVLVSLGGGTNELWVYGLHALGTNTPGWARFQGVNP